MTFALIAEGIVDQNILTYILQKYFDAPDLPINRIQPQEIDGKEHGGGGWRKVLNLCQSDRPRQVLEEEDYYLIIHVDTDISPLKGFNISHTNTDGSEKTLQELYIEVKSRLENLLYAKIQREDAHRVIFAIAIHSIECWLLPNFIVWIDKQDAHKCLDTLNEVLKQNEIPIITGRKNRGQSLKAYEAVLARFMNKSDIENAAEHNVGFQKFVESLQAIINNSSQQQSAQPENPVLPPPLPA